MPGDGLLHPVVLASIALLVLNDHVLKSAVPGLLTGKISDIAGLLFFPLVIQAMHEMGSAAIGHSWGPSPKILKMSIAMAGIGFAAVKLVPVATELFAAALGATQWLSGSLLGLQGAAAHQVQVAQDVTDLIALPILGVTYLIGARRT